MADYAIHRTFLEAMIANRTTPSVAVIVDSFLSKQGLSHSSRFLNRGNWLLPQMGRSA